MPNGDEKIDWSALWPWSTAATQYRAKRGAWKRQKKAYEESLPTPWPDWAQMTIDEYMEGLSRLVQDGIISPVEADTAQEQIGQMDYTKQSPPFYRQILEKYTVPAGEAEAKEQSRIGRIQAAVATENERIWQDWQKKLQSERGRQIIQPTTMGGQWTTPQWERAQRVGLPSGWHPAYDPFTGERVDVIEHAGGAFPTGGGFGVGMGGVPGKYLDELWQRWQIPGQMQREILGAGKIDSLWYNEVTAGGTQNYPESDPGMEPIGKIQWLEAKPWYQKQKAEYEMGLRDKYPDALWAEYDRFASEGGQKTFMGWYNETPEAQAFYNWYEEAEKETTREKIRQTTRPARWQPARQRSW